MFKWNDALEGCFVQQGSNFFFFFLVFGWTIALGKILKVGNLIK